MNQGTIFIFSLLQYTIYSYFMLVVGKGYIIQEMDFVKTDQFE